MSTTPLPAEWATDVPTGTVEIRGAKGDTVATVKVTGSATVTTTWPYTYRQT